MNFLHNPIKLVMCSLLLLFCSIHAQEKEMVVVIPSYNNAQWYQKNLDSVFCQKYGNYRVIYIDDCSPDGTGELVERYIREQGQQHRVTLICNKKNKGAMANHYAAVRMCNDNEIVVNLDGDDWLKHDGVLARVNKEYQDDNVWLTYGQFECYPRGIKGICKEMPQGVVIKNAYREYDWITSHLRTFYAGLFKKINMRDLLDDTGKFYDVTLDMAFMFAMLEMAGGRIKFIPDVLYVYNQDTPLNDYKQKLIEQLHCERLIRSRRKYSRIDSLLSKSGNKQVEALVFADNKPMQLHATLESLQTYCQGLCAVHVFFPEGGDRDVIERMKSSFASAHIIFYTPNNFAARVDSVLCSLKTEHVLCARSGDVLTDFVDLKQCVRELQATHAHGFYVSLGENIVRHQALRRNQNMPPGIGTSDDIFAWQFKYGEFNWRNPLSLNMALYRCADLKKHVLEVTCTDVYELQQCLGQQSFDLEHVGLCFTRSKALILQTGDEKDVRVSDWSTLYDIGFKFNLAPLFRLRNAFMRTESDMILIDV